MKVHGARDSPNGRMCIDRPLTRMRISRKDCGGMLSGCESKRPSDPPIETSPQGLFVGFTVKLFSLKKKMESNTELNVKFPVERLK